MQMRHRRQRTDDEPHSRQSGRVLEPQKFELLWRSPSRCGAGACFGRNGTASVLGASAKAAAVRVSVTRSKLGRLARADTITVGRARRAVGSCARSVSRLRRSANHLRETLDSRARTRAEGCQVYNRVGPMRPAIVFDVKRIRSPSSAAARFRIFTRSTSTGPIPVWRQVSAVVSLGCHISLLLVSHASH
jgi:hypothetical protein